jgi:hypothetical protein
VKQELEKLRRLPKAPRGILKAFEKLSNDVGSTWQAAYRCASERLEKTDAFGSPHTMKASYRRVERAFRDQKDGFRYYLLDPMFTRQLLATPGSPLDRKIAALFAMTPR